MVSLPRFDQLAVECFVSDECLLESTFCLRDFALLFEDLVVKLVHLERQLLVLFEKLGNVLIGVLVLDHTVALTRQVVLLHILRGRMVVPLPIVRFLVQEGRLWRLWASCLA